MYQKERTDAILKLVKENGYVTVKYLTNALHYSNATINRDLNYLERQKTLKRTYGGVEAIEETFSALPFRYHKMKAEKRKIGERAASFVCDGDVIFIDASTTGEYMAEFLAERKDLTVITNNMTLAVRLSEYGISVCCLGGTVVEPPSMLDGSDTVNCAMRHRADKMFFSTSFVTEDGNIGTSDMYYLLHETMAKNSTEIYYLADHEKTDETSPKLVNRILFDFERVYCVISGHEFKKETQLRFPNTRFEKV